MRRQRTNMANNRLKRSTKHIVCLGGGTGTANLMRGLQLHFSNVTTILSMADEGGSGGRLRRLYDIPLGDLVACMTALETDPLLQKLLMYRFPGNRYGEDAHLGGHKVGNLLLVALTHITGSFTEAARHFQKIFGIDGEFLPATKEQVTISAVTKEGTKVIGEENIDLGKYDGSKTLERVYLHPEGAHASDGVVDAITRADVIICGPGDLYTTLLPVLLVSDIATALKKTKAMRIFVLNVANKPYETRGYEAKDFISAIKNHIGSFPFDTIIINNKTDLPLPEAFRYSYVPYKKGSLPKEVKIIEANVVDDGFPLYHSSEKLAKVISESI